MLQVITESACAHKPVLFFCKAGKDRTGLVAALLLSVCGASEEEIIQDYGKWGGSGGQHGASTGQGGSTALLASPSQGGTLKP